MIVTIDMADEHGWNISRTKALDFALSGVRLVITLGLWHWVVNVTFMNSQMKDNNQFKMLNQFKAGCENWRSYEVAFSEL